MGLIDKYPEIKLAKKIRDKHSLIIPFDINALVEKYAEVTYKNIPIEGVDGVSLNLKTPQKKPVIIVNKKQPIKRQKFTLAHELGHIIIPWHLGTIVDNTQREIYKDIIYHIYEGEANRFAAELLMPEEWINEEFNKQYTLGKLHERIAQVAEVSDYAVAIRFIEVLHPEIVYIAEYDGIVQNVGKTLKSNMFTQQAGDTFIKDYYGKYVNQYSIYDAKSIRYHWWILSNSIDVKNEDKRTWREILDCILNDINSNNIETKSSINGILANINDKIWQNGNYNLEILIAASIHRLRRDGLEKFYNHPDFEIFVKNKMKDLFYRRKTSTNY